MVKARYDACSPRRLAVGTVAVTALAVVLMRMPFVGAPAYADEGGYLLVAEHWHTSGPGLYGPLFVDRPPLLILFWKAAQELGGIDAARVLAIPMLVVLVVGAGLSGWLVGGRRGAQWAAIVAGALAANPALGAKEIDSELLAAPLVVTSCLLTLLALQRLKDPAVQAPVAVLAGAIGASAALVKQNLVDALVFAVVLVVTSRSRRAISTPEAARLLGCGVSGIAIPVGATVLWGVRQPGGLHRLVYTLYGFRFDAARVIAHQSHAAPQARLVILLGISLVSGVALLTAVYVWGSRRHVLRGDPLTLAVLAMMAYGVVGVAGGGSFWPHYLLALLPSLTLAAAGLATGWVPTRRWRTAVVCFVAVSSVLVTVGSGFTTTASRGTDIAVTRVLQGAASGGDTGFVAYGHADVLESAGLQPVYRHLWSLPMRVMDPRLHRLTALLAGPRAPTWFVQREDLDSWGLDPDGRLQATVADKYRRVADVCDTAIYLHKGVSRTLPPGPGSC